MANYKKLKESIDYKKEGPCCANCGFYKSRFEKVEEYYGTFEREKEKRCALHKFAVGKKAHCKNWKQRK